MQIIFLGPPASGKGTQSSLIVEKYNIPHISTGDILRKAIKDRTPEGILYPHPGFSGRQTPNPRTDSFLQFRLPCQKEQTCPHCKKPSSM